MKRRVPALNVLLIFCLFFFGISASFGQPTFTKSFTPATIGPGSHSILTFVIDNTNGGPVSDMDFTDVLPAGVTLAAVDLVSNSCFGTVTAVPGGNTITLTDGLLGAGQICEISVYVTADLEDNSLTTYMNVSGDLTSSAGNSGPASDDLMVDPALPGFSKTFSPNSISPGGTSTLTFTIDNFANASNVLNLDFTDMLPAGLVIANIPNISSDCGTPTLPPTITAIPGSNTIILDANGTFAFPALGAGATCTVSVDVTAISQGTFINTTPLSAEFVEAGYALAKLDVPPTAFYKSFTDDPVVPGGTVTLEFTILNLDRND